MRRPILGTNPQPIIPAIPLDLKRMPVKIEFPIDSRTMPQIAGLELPDHARQLGEALTQHAIFDTIHLAVAVPKNLEFKRRAEK
ncbi:hypothetical protein [Prosthecobacter sp.]|uniref:hypothetical protein n=1 Tax=Prosthecobacter sp. TaxID=1965333 RepID=UPI0037840CD6